MTQTDSAVAQDATPQVLTAQRRYGQLESDRNPYLTRGREAAELTIPALLPPEGSGGSTTYSHPYQSVGARGVNNLAAKLLLALFPPGVSFFKLAPDAATLAALKAQAQQGVDVEGEVASALNQIERTVTSEMESSNFRSIMSEVFKHLVTVGNALLFAGPDGTWKWFRLTHYVVVRDLEGTPLEIIAKESPSARTLPEAVRRVYFSEQATASRTGEDPAKPIDLYTRITRKENGSWRVVQEVAGIEIPETRGFYPRDKSAWIPLCWNRSAGENYGRGHVDEYFGDLYSLESLSLSLVDASAAMARIVTLVDEAGVTSRKKLSEAPNLAVIDGNAKDVSVFSMSEKAYDLQITERQAAALQKRLEQAFLLTSSITRDAERVTAEEIRIMANELEQSLGGIYASFSQELQRPVVDRVLLTLQKQNKLPALPDKTITPQIVTGIDGLGRSTEFTRLRLLTSDVGQMFGPEAVADYVNAGAYLTRAAAALGINVEGVIRTEEEVAQMRQQRAQMQAMQALGPDAIKAQASRDIAQTKAAAETPTQ